MIIVSYKLHRDTKSTSGCSHKDRWDVYNLNEIHQLKLYEKRTGGPLDLEMATDHTYMRPKENKLSVRSPLFSYQKNCRDKRHYVGSTEIYRTWNESNSKKNQFFIVWQSETHNINLISAAGMVSVAALVFVVLAGTSGNTAVVLAVFVAVAERIFDSVLKTLVGRV